MSFARLALVALLIPTGAVAAGLDGRAAGTFEHKEGSYDQGVVVKADRSGFTGEFSVGSNGCGGGVTMRGKPTGPATIVFSKATGGLTCRISARYTPDFGSVALEEEGCLMWHGVSCEFSGTLKRTGR